MNMAAAVKLFFVAPATLAIPILIIRLTTGPKNPIIVYPTTGVAAWWDQVLFQIMAQPAIIGRQQRMMSTRRMLGMRLER